MRSRNLMYREFFGLVLLIISSLFISNFSVNVNNKKEELVITEDGPSNNIEQVLQSSNGLPGPILLTPDNNSFHISNVVKFNWSEVGNPSDKSLFYEFVMDNDSDFNSPEVARFAINGWSAHSLADDDYTTFLAHFDGNNRTEDNENPAFHDGERKFISGKFGQGIVVNGSKGNKLTYYKNGNLKNSEGTIEFWVNLEKDIAQINNLQFFYDNIIQNSGGVNRTFIGINNAHKIFVQTWINSIPKANIIAEKVTQWKAGEWHHLCLTWGNEMGHLYLDGIEVATETYFPIGTGTFDQFSIGSQYGSGNFINATFDEFRISSIQRLPLNESPNLNLSIKYHAESFYRYPVWRLNESHHSHMFENDGTYYWKVRAHNSTGPKDWSKTRIINVNRSLNTTTPLEIKIFDVDGDPIQNAEVSYKQTTINKLSGVDANHMLELKYGSGYKWYHQGSEVEVFDLFGDKSVNSFRTRLWMTKDGPNSLENATTLARWAYQNGTMPYLVIFLSDRWADVNKQPVPGVWKGLTLEQRLIKIEDYSKNVTKHFIDEGIDMEFYAIGNEIDYGICGEYANKSLNPRYNITWLKENIWYNASRIINASIKGVLQEDPTAQFMLHLAYSDPSFSLAFFETMHENGIPYDIMGLSYYPSTLGEGAKNGFEETLQVLSSSGLPGSDAVIISESAYPRDPYPGVWASNWNKPLIGYPLTPEGQKNWLQDQMEFCYQHPNVYGMNYWSAETYHHRWTNMSWFNKTGHSASVIEAYSDFFKSRNISISGLKLTNSNGIATIDSLRGFINITINFEGNQKKERYFISPFRDNSHSITLMINISTPKLKIIKPVEGAYYGADPPKFNVTIEEEFLAARWYTFFTGTKKYFFNMENGTIDDAPWDSLFEGIVQIVFHAENAGGLISTKSVIIYKDITLPRLQVNAPLNNSIHGRKPPDYNISIDEDNLQKAWYSLGSGIDDFLIENLTGSINQTLWNKVDDGNVVLTFYAQDKAGNIASKQISFTKDIFDSDDLDDNPLGDGLTNILGLMLTPLGLIIVGIISAGIIGIVVYIRRK